MKKLNFVEKLSLLLVIVGGLNWGLVGLFGYNLVAALFGEMTFLARTIYTLVGLSALYLILVAMKLRKK